MSQSTVWNKITRLLHWAVAISIVLNLFVVEDGDDLHQWIGYAGAAFVLIRLTWGFIAHDDSSFKKWPLSFQHLRTFIYGEFTRNPVRYQGHNPAACLVYFVIWTIVFLLAITGFMMGLDKYWGEEWLENLHEFLSVGLQICIVLHLTGIAVDAFQFKRKTWLGMITGIRPPFK